MKVSSFMGMLTVFLISLDVQVVLRILVDVDGVLWSNFDVIVIFNNWIWVFWHNDVGFTLITVSITRLLLTTGG